jgi:GDPmannose 4,6-dehydratase
MLQHEVADDYVVATGQTHTVREFVELAFDEVGIQIAWKGSGINEIGFDKNSGKELVFVDKQYFRPSEVDLLIGDPSKAERILGWKASIELKELVKDMMVSEIARVKQGATALFG